jgi:hypothetical protein
MSPPPAFDPRTHQPVASRYTDWAISDPSHARSLWNPPRFEGKEKRGQICQLTLHPMLGLKITGTWHPRRLYAFLPLSTAQAATLSLSVCGDAPPACMQNTTTGVNVQVKQVQSTKDLVSVEEQRTSQSGDDTNHLAVLLPPVAWYTICPKQGNFLNCYVGAKRAAPLRGFGGGCARSATDIKLPPALTHLTAQTKNKDVDCHQCSYPPHHDRSSQTMVSDPLALPHTLLKTALSTWNYEHWYGHGM